MILLHTFNSPEALLKFNHRINKDDNVLFIEDGVYCCIDNLMEFDCRRLMALQQDCDLRGIQPAESVELIGYHDWVQMCTEADNHLSWY
ncbi:MAG: hypothetical protein HOI43_15900 [Gammaproteobacteria bacterium]|jgi:sulfur relay protein TusB/DsrH|nr:hypothetical protein [Gammaproteobacteria bacterium]